MSHDWFVVDHRSSLPVAFIQLSSNTDVDSSKELRLSAQCSLLLQSTAFLFSAVAKSGLSAARSLVFGIFGRSEGQLENLVRRSLPRIRVLQCCPVRFLCIPPSRFLIQDQLPNISHRRGPSPEVGDHLIVLRVARC